MASILHLSYPAILQHFQSHLGKGRTESRAFLAWFLEHFYRLEPDQAHDAVCDGPDDKGVDGIYVDDNLEAIDIFQSRLFQNASKTLGDVALKELVGTLTQFTDSDSAQKIADTTSNKELGNLINSESIPQKIRDGYSIRGVFVTNARRDANTTDFLATQPQIALYDSQEIKSLYVPLGPISPMSKPVTFTLTPGSWSSQTIDRTNVIVTSLKATELIELEGIASGALFAWNVRQSLGKTKVNKEIGLSIKDQSEHKNFLLYHNGLTILCKSIIRKRNKIIVSGYVVVNGCQSLTTLHSHKGSLSDELRILTRLIELSPESPLAAKITHHTNNQNPISARDLQSNSSIQRRLQKEFEQDFPTHAFYRIKRGETSDLPLVIDNQDAARVLLAFDLRQPWTCHQTYKLFDELHTSIFARPEVNAKRIVALSMVFETVLNAMPTIRDELMAGYTLTRYFVLYLLRQALENDELGQEFCQDPGRFLAEPRGADQLKECMCRILNDLVIDLNAELKQREESGNPFDYKRELKSPTAVKSLERSVIPPYQMAASRGRATSFTDEWRRT